jgi:hypothetical protein
VYSSFKGNPAPNEDVYVASIVSTLDDPTLGSYDKSAPLRTIVTVVPTTVATLDLALIIAPALFLSDHVKESGTIAVPSSSLNERSTA